MKQRRVVITGLGVVAPNGEGIGKFNESLFNCVSGIKKVDELEELNFGCTIGGIPNFDHANLDAIVPKPLLIKLENKAIKYSCLAGVEAWRDAGFELKGKQEGPIWNAGAIIGSGAMAMDPFTFSKMNMVMSGQARKSGSRVNEQCMTSGAATYLNEIIGFGNVVTSNSSACSTGTEAITQGYERIQAGKADVMLCGSCESDGPLLWGGFDALRIMCSDSNDNPESGSRPLSSNPRGFVPGGGAGALVLESLDNALSRNAKIYAEITGADVINGGHRNGGSITSSNPEATQRCIKSVLDQSKVHPRDIDLICGHFTSTSGDTKELRNWAESMALEPDEMPYINTMKSMIGHCIGAAGSIELVACVLQMHNGFMHGSLNVEELHPDVDQYISSDRILKKTIEHDVNCIIKASLGFGDMNACVILKKWNDNV